MSSVVGDDFVDDWKPLIAHTLRPLAQFHARFWGVKEVADTEGEQEDEGYMNIIILSCYVLDTLNSHRQNLRRTWSHPMSMFWDENIF